MNAQKFTQKSLGAVQLAQDIALERGNMQIEPAHLLAALVEQENGLIPQLLTKMGLDPGAFARDVKALVAGIPATRAFTSRAKAPGSKPILVSSWGIRPFSCSTRAASRWAGSICIFPRSRAMSWASWTAPRDFWVNFCAFIPSDLLIRFCYHSTIPPGFPSR